MLHLSVSNTSATAAETAPRCGDAPARLRARALEAEKAGPGLAEWDRAINVAISVRARAILLGAGGLSAGDAEDVARRAKEATALVLADEARGPRIAAAAGDTLGGARGWGTAKPIHMGTVQAVRVVDAYSTSMVLVSLADWLEVSVSRDPGYARRLLADLAPIADHWLGARSFSAPGGGLSFEKIAVADPAIRHYRVFNTDALFARALLVIGDAAGRLGDGARAARYRSAAVEIGLGLKALVVDRVLGRGGPAHADAWSYALETLAGGSTAPQRGEDANHASFVLDFLSLAAERKLAPPGAGALFSPGDLDRLAALLPTSVFVLDGQGAPAYAVFVDPADVTRDARGKTRSAAFSLAADESHPKQVATWWRQLAGRDRTVDLGQSIRTSWGWVEAARGQPALLETIGRYLTAAHGGNDDGGGANLFLSEATWFAAACHKPATRP
jgi:hypothetical protein